MVFREKYAKQTSESRRDQQLAAEFQTRHLFCAKRALFSGWDATRMEKKFRKCTGEKSCIGYGRSEVVQSFEIGRG